MTKIRAMLVDQSPVGAPEDSCVPPQSATPHVHDGYSVPGQVAAKQPGQGRQEQRLGVTLHDQDSSGEEQVGLGDVEESLEEPVIRVGQQRVLRCERKCLALTHEDYAGEFHLRGEVWTVRGDDHLHRSADRRSGVLLKELHQAQLQLRVQVRLGLLDEEERERVAILPEQQELAGHEQEVVVTETVRQLPVEIPAHGEAQLKFLQDRPEPLVGAGLGGDGHCARQRLIPQVEVCEVGSIQTVARLLYALVFLDQMISKARDVADALGNSATSCLRTASTNAAGLNSSFLCSAISRAYWSIWERRELRPAASSCSASRSGRRYVAWSRNRALTSNCGPVPSRPDRTSTLNRRRVLTTSVREARKVT